MRRWQPLLELLLHHASITVLLCWSFCLWRLGGLSLGVCCFLLLWPWLAEDRMVLGDDSQQLGPSLLILGRFFFLGVGLGLDMKWVRLCQILRPHNSPLKSCCPAPRTEMRVLMSSGPSNGLSSLILCLASGPFCLPKTHFWRFSIQSKSSLNSGGSVLPTLDGVMVIQR